MSDRDIVVSALRYARRGWKVLPLMPNGKTPLARLVPHGMKDATADADTIRSWFAAEPSANLGIATGVGDCGPYVVDVDAPNGGHKNDGAAFLAAAGIELPQTLTATTPNGGRHYYFGLVKPPTADQLKNCANVNGLLGVDVRTAGGYVVAPPSVIDGKPYKFLNWKGSRDLAPFPSELYLREKPAAVPSVCNSHMETPQGAGRPDAYERARMYLASCDAAISGQGGHNATLHAAHALAVGFALDDAAALDLLLAEYNPRCVPPWTEKELRHKVESARANPQKPFGYLLAADSADFKATPPRPSVEVIAGTADQRGKDAPPPPGLPPLGEFAARYSRRRSLADFPDPVPEDENPRALFKGGWLRFSCPCPARASSLRQRSLPSVSLLAVRGLESNPCARCVWRFTNGRTIWTKWRTSARTSGVDLSPRDGLPMRRRRRSRRLFITM